MGLASSIFKLGDVVRATDRAVELGIAKPRQLGTVTGFADNGVFVRIRKDGTVRSSAFAVIFWKPITRRGGHKAS